MAKRRRGRSKKPRSRNTGGLSAKKYKQLKKEAKNVRRRIATFNKRVDADNYNVPSASMYTINELINRIQNGETLKNILSELSGITSASILAQGEDISTSSFGYVLTGADKSALRSAIRQANEAIREAKRSMPGFDDLFPNEFSFSDEVASITTDEYFNTRLEDIQLFTQPGAMTIVATPETGEAITVAEQQMLRNILERENQRRSSQREQQAILANKPEEFEGFLISQNRYDTQQMDIDSFTVDTMRKRAETWNDPSRVYRANIFLDNYNKSLDRFRNSLATSGYLHSDIENKINKIESIISRLYNNEKAITFISKYMPMLDIAIISDRIVSGDMEDSFDFSEIYYDWLVVEDDWL